MHAVYRSIVAGALLLQCCGVVVAAPPPAVKGDLRNGEQVYARCLACHALAENRIGPKHCGLFGRRAGTVPGFDYSPAMRRSNIVWNAQILDRFLVDPMKYVPGTAMVFSGVPDATERADLIAYLQRASDMPACRR